MLDKGKKPIIQDFEGRTKNIILLKKEPRIISKDLKSQVLLVKGLRAKNTI